MDLDRIAARRHQHLSRFGYVQQPVPPAEALDRWIESGEVDRRITAFTLLRAVGNLCILGPGYDRDDAKQMVARLLAGCRA